MPVEEPKTVNLNKVLPMSPDTTVTHVPGLDQTEPRPSGAVLTVLSRTLVSMRTYQGSMETCELATFAPDTVRFNTKYEGTGNV